MVNTRSSVKNERLNQRKVTTEHVALPSTSAKDALKNLNVPKTVLMDTESIKSETPVETKVLVSRKSVSLSKRSTSSSVEARRKRLELQAAEAKARIEVDLIEKRLATEIAELDDEKYSSQSEGEGHAQGEVEQWLERSHHELEAQANPLAGTTSGMPSQPPPPPAPQAAGVSSTDGTVHMLASALKDLAAASTTHGSNQQLLSRLCAPRDLPAYSGDPLEWLQFKQAFEESTRVCNFSDQENLWRLRKCLHGPAKDAVTALLISATSPAVVMSTLELQFGNPDIIISRIMYDIRKLQPMSQEYHKDIILFSIKVKNFVAAIRAVGQEEYLKGTSITSNILSKLPTVLISKWADYSYKLIEENTKPKLVLLSEFLNEEAIKISKTSVCVSHYNPSDFKRKQSDYNANRAHAVLVQNSNEKEKCRFCRASYHKLPDCKRFKSALRKVRWQFVKRIGLCYRCLESRHNRDSCSAPVCNMDNCGQSHHRLLHFNNASKQQTDLPQNDNTAVSLHGQSDDPRSETIMHVQLNSRKVLLKTVPIRVHGPNGVINTVALLDDGSTVSLVCKNLCNRLGVHGNTKTLRISGAWHRSELVCNSEIVNLSICNLEGTMFNLNLCSTDGLNLPSQYVSIDELMCSEDFINKKHLMCSGHCKPEILIGQDNYHLLLPQIVTQCKPKGLYLTCTPLGWCVHGHMPSFEQGIQSTLLISSVASVNQEESVTLNELHETVRHSFSIESMGVSGKLRQNSEHLKAIEHLERTAQLKNGRWHVGLPWKDVTCSMPESYRNAYNRLKGVEKKCKVNPSYAARYTERINHLLDNDYAHELKDNEDTSKTWYLPHFGVDNPNKNKLRLVFDAAAKSNGYSLNDYLLTGPDLLMSLYGIMLRFRENKIAVTGDIRDMFLRIKILPEDQNALRFLWQPPGSSESVKRYAMTSLIFGANCSPFVAQFIKNKNAKQYESSKLQAVHAICKQHYADDYIDSLEDSTTAIQLIKDITHIHKQGGFEIRNWNSNCTDVLNSLPKESLCTSAVRFKIGEQHQSDRTLGLVWYSHEDTLGFDVSFKRIPEHVISGIQRPTKRIMLRVVMSIFDVYGFLSPFTIKAKILLQQMWKTSIGWDDEVPDNIYAKWVNWLQILKHVNNVRLPRCYHASLRVRDSEVYAPNVPNSAREDSYPSTAISNIQNNVSASGSSCKLSYTNLQLHIFCDASTQAMCAVAYWRWINTAGDIQMAFISSKCRVAHIKHISVPRLELQTAVLGARLADTIIKEHKMTPVQKYYWCDSSTVLHWIRNHARDYKPYVAHRLGEIDELSCCKDWHYVPTCMNVADIATRDGCDLNVLQNQWLYGPDFLYENKVNWPKDLPGEVCSEVLERVLLVSSMTPPVPEPEKFSSWLRLLKTTCVVLSFIQKCKKLTGEINGDMMRRAERLLIMYSQSQSFAEDLEHLKNKKILARRSKLLTLSPFVDEYGIVRVGGRIDSAVGISSETKNPVILDGRNYIVKLLVRHYHIKAAHGNNETVVNILKQKYWIIRMRPTIKHIASQCMYCRIRKARPQPPRMGDLPTARMAHHQRPFTYCGVDLFGPMEVTIGRRREKRYGVLFTCMTVRAIHIELVSNLTSDAFIMALRRMSARRGWPQYLYSDNGTNLKGADKELRKSVQALDQNALTKEAANYGTTWTFQPPASPHWGGAWERLIRSVKESLKVVLKERAPRDEVLLTLMAEVEQMVNSRPLTHVSVEAHSDESLTPNHFLLHTSTNSPCIGLFDESDAYLRKQWRISQRLADLFWKRWVREVLPDMRPRTKWYHDNRPVKVGDLVLIVDPNLPRNIWPRGRVVNVMPGHDGRVRVVDVKTKSGVLRRSTARVAVIPMDDEC